jgi:hypothetical protein
MWTDPRSIASRRHWLQQAGGGFGLLALAAMLPNESAAGDSETALTARPHHRPRAKSIIYLFMHGGPSQVDTFDPKPELAKYDGSPPPAAYHNLNLQFTDVKKQKLMASRQTFSRCGQSGIEICDSLPHLQPCADKLCVIRSLHHEVFNHTPAIWLMNSGSDLPGRPSLGAWLQYGLGTMTRDLPSFVVMHAKPLKPGPGVWGNGFLPAAFQGTQIRPGLSPIPYLNPLEQSPRGDQQRQLAYLQSLNEAHARERHDSELDARIASYELAFRMQAAAPEAVDLTRETKATREKYGDGFGEQCLIARRLVERGVRCVQIYHGGGPDDWDSHGDNHNMQARRMSEVDQGSAALVSDLQERGLLDEVLVVWGGEFGRTPTTEGSNGRDHSPYGFSMWLAGGGTKGGHVHGSTDELGFRAAESAVHLHDFNATLLHLFGLDHERLTFRHAGRDFRLTDVFGNVVREILS